MIWQEGHLRLLDQTALPNQEVWVDIHDHRAAIAAISEMRVRGAPAIGVTAAFAMALAAREHLGLDLPALLAALEGAAAEVAAARPTAVNLRWALQRSLAEARLASSATDAVERLTTLALSMQEQDVAANRALGANGAPLLPEDTGVLTHCNTGALATAGYGTALGVIRAAWEQGKRFAVYATETRPWLQGSRLTMWELARLDIPATLIVDSAAAALMRSGAIGAVVVGADRVAANGDTANKIGTYALALACDAHDLPFYVAAPTSTIDLGLADGSSIPIEERPAHEVTHLRGEPIAPPGAAAANPAFDVTPAALITAVITELGVARAPLEPALRALAGKSAGVPS